MSPFKFKYIMVFACPNHSHIHIVLLDCLKMISLNCIGITLGRFIIKTGCSDCFYPTNWCKNLLVKPDLVFTTQP